MPRYYRKLMAESCPDKAAQREARESERRRFVDEPKMSREQLAKNEEFLKARLSLGGRRLE